MAKDRTRLVVLLHGWLGVPGAFGQLPKILKACGHDVLPLFHRFDSMPRAVTLEDLADRLEACLDRERRGRTTVLVAHSMGGLIALTWMLRHHASIGRRPPVERLVTFGTPRHGVWLQPFARAFIDGGLVPGVTLARQMRAPNPFLWALAWAELKHAGWLPPVVAAAGILRRANPISALVGGRESDGVVPAVSSQPNAILIRSNGTKKTLPSRAFRVFPGRSHTGPRGLYTRLRTKDGDERTRLLLSAVEGQRIDASRGDDAMLRQTLCVVRHRPGAKTVLIAETADGEHVPIAPVSRHKDGLSLFVLAAAEPGRRIVWRGLRVGGEELDRPRSGPGSRLAGGQVVYWNTLPD